MSTLDKRVGQSLQRLRRRAAFSTRALAAALKISITDLRRFESGEKRIGPRRLWQVSQALGCPLGAFFAARARSVPTPRRVPGANLAPRVRDQVVALARAYYLLGDWGAPAR